MFMASDGSGSFTGARGVSLEGARSPDGVPVSPSSSSTTTGCALIV